MIIIAVAITLVIIIVIETAKSTSIEIIDNKTVKTSEDSSGRTFWHIDVFESRF